MKTAGIIITIIIFCAGIIIGNFLTQFPYFRFNPEVKLFEPLTFLLTATIGLLIPFYIKRWIDDSRQIKNNLIEELRTTLKAYEVIYEKVRSFYINKSISQNDKIELNILFEQADMKYSCLKQQMNEAFEKETKCILNEIGESCIDYWKHTTSAEMMSMSFLVVTDSFYRNHNDLFLKFETKIKLAIIKVHKI